jgi:hypothetical protein
MILHGAPRWNAQWRRFMRRPRVIAVFSFRYDHHLVADLLENIRPLVDGWVAFDDRKSQGVMSNEPARRAALLEAASAWRPDWILGIDPDERLEHGAPERLAPKLRAEGLVAYGFKLREMYTPDSYRTDGLWGGKIRFNLFKPPPHSHPEMADWHGRWYPREAGYRTEIVDVNLYHLKMITPERRVARAALYEALDPDHRFQKIGYDYLADDSGLQLEIIPKSRGYHPRHREDGGLWMPEPTSLRS